MVIGSYVSRIPLATCTMLGLSVAGVNWRKIWNSHYNIHVVVHIVCI